MVAGAPKVARLGNRDIVDDAYLPPRDTSSHQDRTSTSLSGTPPPAAPTTADTGSTVPQRANSTQTAYAHPSKEGSGPGSALRHAYKYFYLRTRISMLMF